MTPVNFVPLDAKISLVSFNNMRKQESFRSHMFSACLAMVEMVHTLQSLWDALLPFALLWWNVMLCATCAKYYSWNRSRFRLQFVGQQIHGAVFTQVDAEDIREKISLPVHQSGCPPHVEAVKHYASGSWTPAAEASSCFLEQRLPSAQKSDVHQNGLSTNDPHVEEVAACAEEQHNCELEEFSSCEEAPFVLQAHASKALHLVSRASSCKLSPLYCFDIRETGKSGLLKAASWAACPFLLSEQVTPLPVYFETWRMPPNLHINMNFSGAKALMHLFYTVFMSRSSVEESVHVMSAAFASRFAWLIRGKEYKSLIRKLQKIQETSACSGMQNILQVALLLLENVNDMRSITTLETTMESSSEVKDQPSSSNLSSLDLKTVPEYPCRVHDGESSEEADIFDGSNSEFNDNVFVSGYPSCLDSSAATEVGDGGSGYPHYEDSMVAGGGEDTRVFLETSSELKDDYFDVYEGSVEWDVGYNGLQWPQEINNLYGLDYSAADGVYYDGLKVDLAVHYDSRFEEDGLVDESSEVKPCHCLGTWWDEDAVVVCRQGQEEDDIEQAWQVV